MRLKISLYIDILILCALLGIGLKLKSCQKKEVQTIEKEIGSQIVSIGRTEVLRPHGAYIKTSEKAAVQIYGNKTGSEPVGTQTVDIRQLPVRNDSTIVWNGSNGNIEWNRYGLSFAPGISYQTNGIHPGLGIDIRGLYFGDFGLQFGVGLYRSTRAKAQASIGYNLRRTKVLSNTDLIVGIDQDKNLFGGIRCELGNWR